MKRFTRLLVANRGEIACRILRTAKAQGYHTIAMYTDVDARSPHVSLADEAVRIGAGPAADSYLHIERVVAAAAECGAQAVHPGYGFLSENGDFARACAAAGLVFVGPDAHVIDAMGNKAEAKRRMLAAGVPCVPGYEGEDQSDTALIAAAGKLGWPVMIKAAAGGGGRGMRRVGVPDQMRDALERARSEARQAFVTGDLILARALDGARHVEMQVFADAHGNVVHLGERDCSVQRRHQKILEEAPCPVVDDALRARMGAAAVTAASSVAYCGAGTVEFLLDADGAFYFLEMNTRLQVEHPVTELVTGLDLVALQLQVAQGEALGLTQDEVALTGHAIEARLYAEDPAQDFLPQSGTVALWAPAEGPGVRVDAGVQSGQTIPRYYDPLVAKLIAHGPDRETARQRLLGALEHTVLFGVRNNKCFLSACLAHEAFAGGEATTAFVAEVLDASARQVRAPGFDDFALAAALDSAAGHRHASAQAVTASPALANWASAGAVARERTWRVGEAESALAVTPHGRRRWEVHGSDGARVVEVLTLSQDAAQLRIGGRQANVRYLWQGDGNLFLHIDGQAWHFEDAARTRSAAGGDALAGRHVAAPMHAQVLEVRVQTGDVVKEGDELIVLEAMKMQHSVCAPRDGRIANVAAVPGVQVAPDDELVTLDVQAGEQGG